MNDPELKAVLLDLSLHGIIDKKIHPETRETNWQPSKAFYKEIESCAEQLIIDDKKLKPWRAVELGILQSLLKAYPESLNEDQITDRIEVLRVWFRGIFSKRVKERKHE